MGARLFHILDRLSRHRTLVSWSAGGVAALAIVAGIALGAGNATTPAFAALGTNDPAARAPAATVAPGRTSVQGVVLDVRPQGFRIRTADGRAVIVVTDRNTAYRKGGKPLARDGLHRGQKVVVLGKVNQNGRLRARTVAVRGEVKLPAATAAPSPSPTPVPQP